MSTQPLYFGPRERRSFGWLHAPTGTPSGIGVVVCPPIGYEAVLAHRALRHLAERLSASGHAVLRLDYHGTGDAAGLDEDPQRLEAWLGSIADARALLTAEGCSTIALYGLRLGALLAARAGADLLVMHAPIGSGRAYVRELRAFRRLAAASGLSDESTTRADPRAEESAGFVIWSEAADALSTIDLTKLDATPAREALFIPREDLPSDEPIARRFTELAVEVTRTLAGGYAAMMQDPHKSEVPHAAWSVIADWLDARRVGPSAQPRAKPDHDRVLGEIAPPRIDRARVLPGDGPSVRETPIRFGPDERLFGILTEPEGVAPSGKTLVLLNPGSVHRIGSNRMHVLWARAWAARGRRVLRLDIGGIGDSATAPGGKENQTYSQTAVADVEAAIAEVTRRGAREVVLIGLCSGAYVAFHTARVSPVDSVILINPQTFDYKEGDPLDVAAARNASEAAHYRRSFASIEKWRKLVSGEVNLMHVAAVVWTRARSTAITRATNLMRRFASDSTVAEGALGGELRRVVERTRVHFVYSSEDPGLDHLEREAGEAMRRLRAEHRVSFELIDDADHTFTSPDAQRRLFALLSRLLGEAG